MGLNRERVMGRKESGHFAAIPKVIIDSPNFHKMSGNAVKLLLQMISMLRFGKDKTPKNNGDLSASWTLMKECGWRSKDTLQRARDELLYYGFIEITRLGQAMTKGKPHLYALTFHAIDECKGKLDVRPTRVASGKWKEEKNQYDHKQHKLSVAHYI